MADTTTVRLEANGESDELTVPTALVRLLAEDGEETTEVVGDMAMLALAQQAHGIVHHSRGDVDPQLEEAEQTTMDLFEERFGQSYAEMTGHDH
jgi:hypothetical protein